MDNHNFVNWYRNNQQVNKYHNATDFEMKVYEFVSQIPIGKVATYKQVAEAIGCPNASRAVGTALAKNPFADPSGQFYVPCHRVINSNFKIGGFMGSSVTGAKTCLKSDLLQSEGVIINNGSISGPSDYRHAITTF
jgi:O-6-methylguanine DNA methyltransferase